jgi:transcriptional regulator with XRE-family HTH domain
MLNTRLKALICHLGIKENDFAQKTGFSQPYISMILRGKKTNPSPRFFDSISRVFHVNAEWLRSGSGEMFSVPDLNISASEASLLAKYRLLPAHERAVIDEVIDAILLKSMMEGDEK